MDSTPPLRSVLILAALAEEEGALLDLLKNELGSAALIKSTLNRGLGLELTQVALPSRSIAVVRTGIGPVNAALALAIAHERVQASAVILLGVGGALREDLDVGDLVISSRVLQHDYFYSFDHGDVRIRPGALILSSEEARGCVPDIAADPNLVAWLKKAEKSAEKRATTAGKVLEGTILSGTEFVGRVDRKRAIAALRPDALLVDMEATGVAQTASQLGLPFAVAKTVADRLLPNGSIESDFRACLAAACSHAAAAVHSLL